MYGSYNEESKHGEFGTHSKRTLWATCLISLCKWMADQELGEIVGEANIVSCHKG